MTAREIADGIMDSLFEHPALPQVRWRMSEGIAKRRDDIESALLAAERRGVKVKPLEWGDTHAERGIHMQARTPFGRYVLKRGTGFCYEVSGPAGFREAYKFEEAAQAAAQADYEARIRSALVPDEDRQAELAAAERRGIERAAEVARVTPSCGCVFCRYWP